MVLVVSGLTLLFGAEVSGGLRLAKLVALDYIGMVEDRFDWNFC